MNTHMQSNMSEAMRLMQEGRLTEATALIQRNLGGTHAPTTRPEDTTMSSPGTSGKDGFDKPIDVSSTIINEDSYEGADEEADGASRSGFAGSSFRPASKSSGGFRGARGASSEDWFGGFAGGFPAGFPAVAAEPTGPGESLRGRFVEKSYRDGAGSRAYKLYVPSGYVGQSVPMVVMMHGCTQTADDFSVGSRMNALAEEQTFIVAYPAQSSNANFSKCWNWYEPTNQRRGQGEPSIVAGITKEVCEEYRIEGGRVYVAGLSSGGAMAAIMGETYPELYAAVGVHSGLAYGSASDLSSAFSVMRSGARGRGKSSATPLIVFQGDADTTVHPSNANHLLERWISNGSAKLPPTEEHHQPTGVYSYTRTIFPGGEYEAPAERWIVHGLGHAWSGGSRSGSYTDSRGPDASAQMIRFFEQNRRS